MLLDLVNRLSRILFLRAGPQDLPTSHRLQQYAAVAFVATTVMQMAPLAGVGIGLGFALLALIMLGGYVRMLLRSRGLAERYTQTMTALLLVNSAIGLIMLLPILQLAPVIAAHAEQGQAAGTLELPQGPMNLMRVLSIWGLVVAAHIYRHALNIHFALGICVTLFFQLLLLTVVVVATLLAFTPT